MFIVVCSSVCWFFCTIVASLIGLQLTFGKLLDQAQIINNETLQPVCIKHGEIDPVDGVYFSRDFFAKYSFARTKKLLAEVMPETLDCAKLFKGNWINVLTSSQGISFVSNMSGTVFLLSYPVEPGGQYVTVECVQAVTGKWVINDITFH